MTRFNQYGKAGRVPIPCATCGRASTGWFSDGSPSYDHSHYGERKPYYKDDLVTLYHADSTAMLDELPTTGLLVLDPPFRLWSELPAMIGATVIAFTSPGHRDHVESLYGKPRTELVWSFDIARWVSHELPLVAHESILVYGLTASAYVGSQTDGVPRDKGSGSVGEDTYPTRTYTPRDRRALTSVLSYPRNPRSKFGIWEKPLPMMQKLIAWVAPTIVVDPFVGSGTTLVAAKSLGLPAVGVEIDEAACEIAANRCRQDVLGLSA